MHIYYFLKEVIEALHIRLNRLLLQAVEVHVEFPVQQVGQALEGLELVHIQQQCRY